MNNWQMPNPESLDNLLRYIIAPRQTTYLSPKTKRQVHPKIEAEANEIAAAIASLPQPDLPRLEYLLRLEAEASSAIEVETSPDQVQACIDAVKYLLDKPVNARYLQKTQGILMAGREHAQPGRYRTVNVRVGNHIAPEPSHVPQLMRAKLYRYIKETADPPPLAAAWAHAVFETIHPFADGNGRTGRALILRILEYPLPVSQAILAERPRYYALLGSGRWENFADWMLSMMNRTIHHIGRGEQWPTNQ